MESHIQIFFVKLIIYKWVPNDGKIVIVNQYTSCQRCLADNN